MVNKQPSIGLKGLFVHVIHTTLIVILNIIVKTEVMFCLLNTSALNPSCWWLSVRCLTERHWYDFCVKFNLFPHCAKVATHRDAICDLLFNHLKAQLLQITVNIIDFSHCQEISVSHNCIQLGQWTKSIMNSGLSEIWLIHSNNSCFYFCVCVWLIFL